MEVTLKKIALLFSLVVACMLVATLALAQSVGLPSTLPVDGDMTNTFLFLIQNLKALGPIGIGMVVVTIVIQATKSDLLGNWFKKLSDRWQVAVITFAGLLYGAAYTIMYTKQGFDVFIVGFISSGGAVSLFHLIKMLFTKKEAAKTEENKVVAEKAA